VTDRHTLQALTKRMQREALADNTHLAYSTAARRYNGFGDRFDFDELYPATDQLLSDFATFLMSERLAYQTIKNYLFGVRSTQLNLGMEFPPMCERYLVRQTLKGIRRNIGDERHPKMPITVALLRRFARVVNTKRCDPTLRVRWGAIWAAILVGFFGMLRKDNLTKGKSNAINGRQGLTRNDVRLRAENSKRPAVAWLQLRYSKTNQTRQTPLVIPVAATGDELCPVAAVTQHLRETSHGTTKEDNLLLMPAGRKPKDGPTPLVPLTHTVLVGAIKELATATGVDADKYAGHSLRRGGATMAFRMGVSSHLIKQQGGWKSDAVFLYHQLSAEDRLRLPALMATHTAQLA
jgi:hypothetical protein